MVAHLTSVPPTLPPTSLSFKAASVTGRLKSLGASVDGLLSEAEGTVLDSLPTSLAAAKTSPVTRGSFGLMQKIVSKSSNWPDK